MTDLDRTFAETVWVHQALAFNARSAWLIQCSYRAFQFYDDFAYWKRIIPKYVK
jgi:hypothetical protein